MKQPDNASARARGVNNRVLGAQLAATLLALAFVPGNGLKLAAFALIWGLTFRRLSSRELICYAAVCALFSVMDIMAVRDGAFQFMNPDAFGLPVWEYFMWGFYVLHVVRTLNGPAPPTHWRLLIPLVVVFALPFLTVSDPLILLLSSSVALAIALAFFHEAMDLKYVAYTVMIGAAFEYLGVWTGQWRYPGEPPGGVAFWFVTLWGGIGLFVRRLVLPLLAAAVDKSDLHADPVH